MRQSLDSLTFQTNGRGLLEITRDVAAWTKRTSIDAGLLTIFCRHTSASLLIQENASPDVRIDLEAFFEAVAPEDPSRYRHSAEGPDDMPAHIRTVLSGVSLSVPVGAGAPMLGRWQGIFLFEHRRQPHRRELALHLIGE
jgi:secondary thiamine-phosphate synthase enzyme